MNLMFDSSTAVPGECPGLLAVAPDGIMFCAKQTVFNGRSIMADEASNSEDRRKEAIQEMIKRLRDPGNTGRPLPPSYGPRYSDEEFARRGREIYAKIKHLVDPGNDGKVLAIDIETGAYEIDDDPEAPVDRLFARFPEPQIFRLRIGYDAVVPLSGRPRRIAS